MIRFVPLVLKQVWRHRVRTGLTVLGIAAAMFLFTSVRSMEQGVRAATSETARDVTLIVYREDRFCPATSVLPEVYERRIAGVEGVRSVMPVKVVVNNCRTSLDVVTFRGVPKERFLEKRGGSIGLLGGSLDDWRRRSDAVLVGETLAQRRGLLPGMTFDAAGITAYVAGVIRSENAQDRNVAYGELQFVQQASGSGLGEVTQFEVRVEESGLLEPVSRSIDELFASAQEPTTTFGEKAFVSRVAGDVIELVGFARWLGIGCLAAVLALIGNAIVLSVQSRVSEHAVLQTLGYRSWQVAGLIVAEGVLVALVGGALGAGAAVAVVEAGSFALSVEGLSIPVEAGPAVLATGLVVCVALSVIAGLVPAWRAGRREIAACFRAV